MIYNLIWVLREHKVKKNILILSKNRILEEIEKKSILIEPFNKKCLGPNSYDIHLGRYLAVYNSHTLDSKEENVIEEIVIPADGYTLYPGKIYLGVTEEYTETLQHVPFLEGISSVARLGINVNPSSGKGNIGHCNTWTLDITKQKIFFFDHSQNLSSICR